MYVLGDVLDRGSGGMKILLDMAGRSNMILLMGNHDRQAYILLSNLYRFSDENYSKELADVYRLWMSDGGRPTVKEYVMLSDGEREIVMKTLKKSLMKKERTVNQNIFLMAHTVPGADRVCEYEQWNLDDYTIGRPDYQKVYFKDKYIITGHTPTEYIDKKSKGKIWMGNRHIAVDCGAVFGNPLGCLCLDTLEEFYVT